ncbi:hypothetical protein [Robertmurraya massiliosenegalensis]|uniref:hypothetical protein n=1 Tax=Robertmurraya massiliosenegalensis TaxID=1287657 RepID=UPI0003102672|nr:hypothetical protein [Robertmurraya massiliosenegalensis]
MKRYWKISLLSIAMVIVLGTFYLQSGLAAKDNVKIEFKKISGDEAELNDLVLFGDYRIGDMTQSFRQVSTKETLILNNRSFLEEVLNNNYLPVFEKLIDEHRSFMRGKDIYGNSFFENENLLAYAGMKRDFNYSSIDYTLDVDILDKKTNDTNSFQYKVPNANEYGWYDVEDVQIFDGILSVIVRSSLTTGGEEASLYTFDMETQKLVNNEKIVSTSTVENGWSGLILNDNQSSIQPEEYILIEIESESYENEQSFPSGVKETFVYNKETNVLKEVKMPEELADAIYSSTIKDGRLYFSNVTEKGFEVHQYDIEKEQWEAVEKFDKPDMKNGYETTYTTLMNGKLYSTYLTDSGHILFIGDVTTGETLYEGKIIVDHPDYTKESLYIHYIE